MGRYVAYTLFIRGWFKDKGDFLKINLLRELEQSNETLFLYDYKEMHIL